MILVIFIDSVSISTPVELKTGVAIKTGLVLKQVDPVENHQNINKFIATLDASAPEEIQNPIKFDKIRDQRDAVDRRLLEKIVHTAKVVKAPKLGFIKNQSDRYTQWAIWKANELSEKGIIDLQGDDFLDPNKELTEPNSKLTEHFDGYF